mgnify:CR=1 FL=1
MKIKRYEIKESVSKDDLLAAGAVTDGNKMLIMKYITIGNSDFRIVLTFDSFKKSKVKSWNDIDNVCVEDTDSGTRYKLFRVFQRCNEDVPKGGALYDIATAYHQLMGSLPFMAVREGADD